MASAPPVRRNRAVPRPAQAGAVPASFATPKAAARLCLALAQGGVGASSSEDEGRRGAFADRGAAGGGGRQQQRPVGFSRAELLEGSFAVQGPKRKKRKKRRASNAPPG
jgi:hypothetical protein